MSETFCANSHTPSDSDLIELDLPNADGENQFAIDCEEHANWLVRKVVSARQYAARVKKWAEQEQKRAAREERTLLFLFGRQIEQWAQAEIDKLNGRRKSVNLPAGSLGFRTSKPSLVIDDEQAVLNWARSAVRSAVVVTERLSRSAINQHIEATGELPPQGARVEPPREQFFIR